MASRRSNWYTLIFIAGSLFVLSTSLTMYAGVPPVLAIITNIFQSLQIPYNIISYTAAATPFELAANLMDTVVFALLTVILATWFYDFITSVSIKERMVLNRIRRLKEHVIVAPYNAFGKELMRNLKEEGIAAVAMASSRSELLSLVHRNELAVVGDIKLRDSFEAAGIASARYIIAASDDDLENALIAITAKTVNPHVKIIARVNKEESIPKLDIAGAYKMIMPEITAGELIGEELAKTMMGGRPN
ncbi:MAG TPA: NAD(P)-binding protein [Candidatus Baltobacteraceae bacterium]|nr:NAD(P)-binding protein [Candidatus Baltobacteraceae bacterium]